tara:strand:- start:9376 stop:9495 length:120 start_codon:yes stop_codon:yes gene_type:complete
MTVINLKEEDIEENPRIPLWFTMVGPYLFTYAAQTGAGL